VCGPEAVAQAQGQAQAQGHAQGQVETQAQGQAQGQVEAQAQGQAQPQPQAQAQAQGPLRTLVFDVCCGTGTIGMVVARRAAGVVGVDINPFAVKDAEANAAINGLQHCTFVVAGKVGEGSLIAKLSTSERKNRGERKNNKKRNMILYMWWGWASNPPP